MNRADGLFGHSLVVLAIEARNAEIHDLYCSVAQQHYIGAFNIAVYYSPVVCMLQSAQYLNRKMNRVAPFEQPLLFNGKYQNKFKRLYGEMAENTWTAISEKSSTEDMS